MDFTLGIDLSNPIGSLFSLTNATPLTALNGPDGIATVTYDHDGVSSTSAVARWTLADRTGQADVVRFTLSDGTSFDVNLDNKVNVGEVLAAIESGVTTALGARYTTLYSGTKFANIDNVKKAFYFVDRTRGEVGDFSITSIGNSNIGLASIGLGIYGSATKPDSNGNFHISGASLHNDSLAKRLYLVSTPADRPTIGGSVSVTANDIDASLKVLIAEASVLNGTGSANVDARVSLVGWTGIDGILTDSDGKLTLQEIIDLVDLAALRSSAITAVASGGLVEITSQNAHDLRTGDRVEVSGVMRIDANGLAILDTSINGTWTVTISAIDPKKFTLNGSNVSTTRAAENPTAKWQQVKTLELNPQVSGSMNVKLPVRAKAPWLAAGTEATGDVIVSWPDITSLDTLSVTHASSLNQLVNFSELSGDDLLLALRNATDYLSQLEQFGFLKDKLPILNRSLSDLVGLGSQFKTLADGFSKQPVQTLLQLETALETALGLPASAVEFSADGNALRISFDFTKLVDEQLNLNLSLDSLGIAN